MRIRSLPICVISTSPEKNLNEYAIDDFRTMFLTYFAYQSSSLLVEVLLGSSRLAWHELGMLLPSSYGHRPFLYRVSNSL